MKKNLKERLAEITQIDLPLWQAGRAFAGIDEAGRGPLAGPVVAACVAMPPSPLLEGVDDSKKLSEKRREALFERVRETALFVGVGVATAEEIDDVNILRATKRAMQRAAQGAPCDLFLVDAVEHLDVSGEVRGIVHGDALCYSIAAASIIAKVTRDRMLRELDARYPEYGFARHKGYGTKAHIEALRQYGPCPEHRRSFIGHFVDLSRPEYARRGAAL